MADKLKELFNGKLDYTNVGLTGTYPLFTTDATTACVIKDIHIDVVGADPNLRVDVNGVKIGYVERASGSEIVGPNSTVSAVDFLGSYPQECKEMLLTSWPSRTTLASENFFTVGGEVRGFGEITETPYADFSQAYTGSGIGDHIRLSGDGTVLYQMYHNGNQGAVYRTVSGAAFTAILSTGYSGMSSNEQFIARGGSYFLKVIDYANTTESSFRDIGVNEGRHPTPAYIFSPNTPSSYCGLGISSGEKFWAIYRYADWGMNFELYIPDRYSNSSYHAFVIGGTSVAPFTSFKCNFFCTRPSGSSLYFGGTNANNSGLYVHKVLNAASDGTGDPYADISFGNSGVKTFVLDDLPDLDGWPAVAMYKTSQLGDHVIALSYRNGAGQYGAARIDLLTDEVSLLLSGAPVTGSYQNAAHSLLIGSAETTEAGVAAVNPDFLSSINLRITGIETTQ